MEGAFAGAAQELAGEPLVLALSSGSRWQEPASGGRVARRRALCMVRRILLVPDLLQVFLHAKGFVHLLENGC
jgi:hypothetical protein